MHFAPGGGPPQVLISQGFTSEANLKKNIGHTLASR